MAKYSLIIVFLAMATTARSQPVIERGDRHGAFDAAKARFEHLTVADGLPENSASSLLQDHLGFIWIGTQNGLARYDGTEMKAFQYDPADPYSFRGQVVMTMIEDQAGDLWIGTFDNGLIHYERATGRFISYRNDPDDSTTVSNNTIFSIAEDHRGDIWVVTGAGLLDRLARDTGAFTRIRHDPDDQTSLSSGAVIGTKLYSALLEDRAGTIWIGTVGGGLNRFDPDTGTFSHFRHDPDDVNSLSDDRISQITEDGSGHLWISTLVGGLNRFDPQTGLFMRYRHDPGDTESLISDQVALTFEDQSGALWITTQEGLDRFEPETETFTHFAPDPGHPGAPSHKVLYPVLGDESGVWFLTGDNGLNFFDGSTFTNLAYDPKDPAGRSPNAVSLLKDRSGTVWVGTINFGLDKLDRSVRFPLIRHDPDDPNSLSDNRVSVLYEAPSEPGILWIGTQGGLDRYDRATGRFSHYRHDPADRRSLNADGVQSIFEDAKQRFWVGTTEGFSLMDRPSGTFTRYVSDPNKASSLIDNGVVRLLATRDGGLWLGTDGGLDRVDPDALAAGRDPTFTHYTATADTSYHPDLMAWISSHASSDRRIASLLHVRNDADLSKPFTLERPVRGLVVSMGELAPQRFDYGWIEDEQGNIVWEMTRAESRHAGGDAKNRVEAALVHFDAGTYRLRYHSDDSHGFGVWNAPAPDDPGLWGIQVLRVGDNDADLPAKLIAKPDTSRLSQNEVRSLYEDREGLLWIGTDEGGLNRFDPKTGQFKVFRDDMVGPTSVSAIFEDRGGRLWLGDYIGGLHRIDRERGSVKRYTIKDGLPSNSINTIVEDDRGFLWLGTFNGLSRFDPVAETFRNYDTSHGLQGELIWSGFRSADGTLFFGGRNGFNAIDPTRLTDDTQAPEVAFTGFDLFTEPLAVGPDSPLKKDVSVAEQITLAHDQNDFTIHFAALQFNRPGENTAAYALTPYDADFVEAGARREARYTNLSPGTYTFHVKAANADGVWNEEGASIRVVILPPWWQTWWAYALYGILLIGGVIGVDRVQRRRLLRREQERARERELEQAREIETAYHALREAKDRLVQSEKLASLGALTAGIAHEIKNPLNFINNFAEINVELADELAEGLAEGEDVAEVLSDMRENALRINQHGKRADGIVRSMMQHARGSGGQRESVEVNAFVEEYLNLAYHGQRARVPDFNADLVTDFAEDTGTVEMVPQEMGRVLINLIGNAFDAVYAYQTETRQGASIPNGEAEYAPVVRVTTRRQNGRVEIRVADNGPGIPDDVKAKIFEPFFTTKPTGSGTGLGLSLSHDIVTQGHGGTLTVESAPGEGAAFVVSVPVEGMQT